MVQSNLQQINLYDLLTLRLGDKIMTGQVTSIKAIYDGKNRDDKQHTAEVDSVSIEVVKAGQASIQVNNDEWISYANILQKAKQPSFLKFAIGWTKRFFRKNITLS